MKYRIRRAVLGIILSPVFAFLYVVFCAVLIGLGAEPSFTVQDAWANGFFLSLIPIIIFVTEPLATNE